MKLTKARVQRFRSIDDSTEVDIDPEVTCLVGKNESGKTAFLQAVTAVRAARPGQGSIDVTRDYPRQRYLTDRADGTTNRVDVAAVWFELDDDDAAAVETVLGPGALRSRSLKLVKRYDDPSPSRYSLSLDQAQIVKNVLEGSALPDAAIIAARDQVASIAELIPYLEGLADTDGVGPVLKTARERANPSEMAWAAIKNRVPHFFYFSDYGTLPGRVDDIAELLTKPEEALTQDQDTARALLALAGATREELTDENYETRKAELEAISNVLTAEIFQFWTQNPHLRVQIDIEKNIRTTPRPNQGPIQYALDLRVWDQRHQMTMNFERRSSGFVWFFSFLAAFSRYRTGSERVVILLDEPGLGLHARAQADLLRYINDRLGPNHQVIYSTHSPFMVEAQHVNRVRVVEDKPAQGTVVSANVAATDRDTLFPIQAALGFDLARNLFVDPHNLVVAGASDFIFLSSMSAAVAASGRIGLDQRWTITPVGGADKIPTFIALLGVQLPVVVFVDTAAGENQRIRRMVADKYLDPGRLITPARFTATTKDADVEDMFAPQEYLVLYNAAFGSTVSISDLKGTDSIVRRIARHVGAEFDHLRPAMYLLQPDGQEFCSKLSSGTLDRFAKAFEAINATLGSHAGVVG